ncbi:hypothetical protein ACH3XW_19265 [Acanthocheilonema viteae]
MEDEIAISRKFNEAQSNKRCGKKPEISTDDTIITLAGPENQLRHRSDLKNLRKHKQNAKSKKDANLSKRGRLKLSYEHLKDFFSRSKKYFDEVELRKKGLTNDKINTSSEQNIAPTDGQMKRSKERIQRGSYYESGSSDPSAENYITDAEINTRGYIDRNGQIHYSIPVLPRGNEPKHTVKRTEHVTISHRNSGQSIHLDTTNSKSELRRKRDGNIVGVVTCSVGDKDDRGRLDYQVYDDGRIYDLRCSDGRSLVLSFSKKDAALVTNLGGSENPSLS